MADVGAGETRARTRRPVEKRKRKRKSRQREKLMDNLKWMAAGVAVGLPVLGVLIYAVSRF